MTMHMFTHKSQEWLEFRKKHITATEAASLVGVNSYLTANQLLKQKLSGANDFVDNEHIWDGYIAEPGIFKGVELMGWDIDPLAPRGKVLVFSKDGFSSTPDNFRWDDRAIIEAKKTLKHNFEKNWMGTCPPLRYLSQVQVQMHTTGFDKAYLICTTFEDNIPMSIYEVHYDVAFNNLLATALLSFSDWIYDVPKRVIVPKSLRELAADRLKDSYTFLGVFRRGKKEENESIEWK